ncbi:hypothetical protein [Nocardioides albus]|uniref:Uncharacterized protein n=1 Tax=Nocardioides albus TaxID=1841 RepID=A0A7W5A1L6_9ACTN|nr:hypothetical protein [Nocardioides albus]MBB3087992.1 hypothetical protein [Nocardioides albus]
MSQLLKAVGMIVLSVVSVFVALTVVATVLVAFANYSGSSRDPQTTVTDEEALSTWKMTLAPALDDLNSLQDPPKVLSDEPARVTPCAIDESDGSLAQLDAWKSWTAEAVRDGPARSLDAVLPEIRSGYSEIVKAMVARGWTDETGVRAETENGVTEPVMTTLTRANGDVRVRLRIDMYTDWIIAGLKFPGAPRGCRLAD